MNSARPSFSPLSVEMPIGTFFAFSLRRSAVTVTV
jgi:hypothetical protein